MKNGRNVNVFTKVRLTIILFVLCCLAISVIVILDLIKRKPFEIENKINAVSIPESEKERIEVLLNRKDLPDLPVFGTERVLGLSKAMFSYVEMKQYFLEVDRLIDETDDYVFAIRQIGNSAIVQSIFIYSEKENCTLMSHSTVKQNIHQDNINCGVLVGLFENKEPSKIDIFTQHATPLFFLANLNGETNVFFYENYIPDELYKVFLEAEF